MVRKSILSYLGLVIIFSSGLCLSLLSVCSFVLKSPFILTRTNILSKFTTKWSCAYFLVLIPSRVNGIYTHVLISFCSNFHSTRGVRGAEVNFGLETQNREPRLASGSCWCSAICVTAISIAVFKVGCLLKSEWRKESTV